MDAPTSVGQRSQRVCIYCRFFRRKVYRNILTTKARFRGLRRCETLQYLLTSDNLSAYIRRRRDSLENATNAQLKIYHVVLPNSQKNRCDI